MPGAAIAERLNQLLSEAGSPPIDAETGDKFVIYLELLQKWNARTNLTAIRDEDGILSRHFLESILCARALPLEIETMLDFGSGAGFPGIPIALIRKELSVTLAESQNKKAAFLREVIRSLDLTAKVHASRAEDLTIRFDCVTMRAVDHMEKALPSASKLLTRAGYLAVMTTLREAPEIQSIAAELDWQPAQALLRGTERVLLLGQNLESR